ncbi:diablo homolog, mitochondrial [Lingula anatina]|uniref:Direct IAP-binding protein with low pI n=1 Tax=Lingula anatina TaxID=7574 RepID=A0A1S3IG82_LINAN|nr:diablo homolog, mitochondrial [Lingula anatina]|eukprot:XP_013397227.1 diablo homolog, mitochondrial [Lingula anatina]
MNVVGRWMRTFVRNYKTCNRKRYLKGSVGASLFTLHAKNTTNDENSPGGIQTVNPVHLSHPYLIRNAAVSSVDAATTLLTQIVTALLQAQKEYIEAVSHLLTVMEANLKVLGNPAAEQQVWDMIMEARVNMNEKAMARQELETLYAFTEKLLNSAAEAAYAAGAEYASIAASERIYSAQTQLKVIREQSKDATLKLAQMEATTIQKTSEQLKENKKDSEDPSS